MKTTIDIADDLAERAKALAAARGTTLRAIVEEGLRATLSVEEDRASYKLPDCSVSGKGLREGFEDADWQKLRGEIYKGRGE